MTGRASNARTTFDSASRASLRWSVGERHRLRFLYAHSAQVQPSYHVNEFGLVAYYTVIRARPTDAPAELTPQMQPRAPMSR